MKVIVSHAKGSKLFCKIRGVSDGFKARKRYDHICILERIF